MSTRYDTDFYAWTQEQAALLRDRAPAVDWDHLAEEIESLGRSEQRAIVRRLRRLLTHLWKLQHGTPHDLERAGRGWRKTVETQRRELVHLLVDNPSLGRAWSLEAALARAWELAGLDVGSPEPACPWTLEECMREDWYPV